MQPAFDLRPDDWFWGDLLFMHYGVIYIDPPWYFKNFSAKGEGKNPVSKYKCMEIGDIAKLPVAQLSAKDGWIVMWGTFPMLDQQIAILKGWGYLYITGGAWDKKLMGTGYVRRSRCEPYLIGKIGNPKCKPAVRSTTNLILPTDSEINVDLSEHLIEEKRRESGRKPDQMIEQIEAGFHGPYCEIFSRTNRPGWDSWGDEQGKFDA